MRKILLLLSIILCFVYTSTAGWVVNGITSNNVVYGDLMNYTLSFDDSGKPIAAASMHSSLASGNGRNSIVIVPSDPSQDAHIFEIVLSPVPAIQNIEVRDFQKVTNDRYLICGSRQIDNVVNAFVAVVYNNFERMQFYEYPEADCFYSIWAGDISLASQHDYAFCGVRGDRGVVGSLDVTTLSLINFYMTTSTWEYHKIILKKNPDGHSGIFVVSGMNQSQELIGFTTIDPSFTQINSFNWRQKTEPDSHCVVGDYIGNNYRIIIASSYKDEVILTPFYFSGFAPPPIAYHFVIPGYSYHLQDIGTIVQDDGQFRISVAGYTSSAPPVQYKAWHGYVLGPSNSSTMENNYYYKNIDEQFKNYKIGYYDGEEYTSGYFEGEINTVNSMCAFFSSPLNHYFPCDDPYTSSYPYTEQIVWDPFYLQTLPKPSIFDFYESFEYFFVTNDHCGDLKGSKNLKSILLSSEKEIEIITFPDHITVINAASNTDYQVYNVVGQLVQIGTTNSDISTTKLNKGVYILRLENGKTFKFVK